MAEGVAVEEAPVDSLEPTMVTYEPMTANYTSEIRTDVDAEEAPLADEEEVVDEPTTSEPEAEEQPPATPVDLNALSDEDFQKLVRDNKRLQDEITKRTNGLVGNRLQREREAAAAQERQRVTESQQLWETATARWQEIEALAEDDPDEYREVINDPAVAKFRSDYLAWKGTRVAEAAPKPADPSVEFQSRFVTSFNNEAIGEFRDYAKAAISYYGELPERTRKAIESAAYDPNGNWFAESVTELVRGIDSRWEKRLKTEVEAARQAAKNEALADPSDQPLIVGSKGPARSAQDIIAAHANGEHVDQATLYRAYDQRGIPH